MSQSPTNSGRSYRWLAADSMRRGRLNLKIAVSDVLEIAKDWFNPSFDRYKLLGCNRGLHLKVSSIGASPVSPPSSDRSQPKSPFGSR